jgi:hypothetical protein
MYNNYISPPNLISDKTEESYILFFHAGKGTDKDALVSDVVTNRMFVCVRQEILNKLLS